MACSDHPVSRIQCENSSFRCAGTHPHHTAPFTCTAHLVCRVGDFARLPLALVERILDLDGLPGTTAVLETLGVGDVWCLPLSVLIVIPVLHTNKSLSVSTS